jgi:hypothetical protein
MSSELEGSPKDVDMDDASESAEVRVVESRTDGLRVESVQVASST